MLFTSLKRFIIRPNTYTKSAKIPLYLPPTLTTTQQFQKKSHQSKIARYQFCLLAIDSLRINRRYRPEQKAQEFF